MAFVPGQRIAFERPCPHVGLEGTEFSLSVRSEGDGDLLTVRHEVLPQSEKWTDRYGGAEWRRSYFARNLTGGYRGRARLAASEGRSVRPHTRDVDPSKQADGTVPPL